jgi:hypothetical protein
MQKPTVVAQSLSASYRPKAGSTPSRPKLEPEASAVLREQLTAELKDISSTEQAAIWARRVIAVKNSLTAADAECVEQAFQARLTLIAGGTATRETEAPVDHPVRTKKRHRSLCCR